MFPAIALSFVVGVVTLWFWCFYYYYRDLKTIPSPKVLPILGSALEFKNVSETLQTFSRKMKELNTKTIRVHLAFRAIVMTQDYKFIEFLLNSNTIMAKGMGYDFFKSWLGEGLVTTSLVDHWRKHRKMITPTFHFQILEQFIDVFNSNGTILIKKLRERINEKSVDIFPYVTLCALDIICETAMGTPINAQLEEFSVYTQSVKDIGRIAQERGFNPLLQRNWIFRFTKMRQEERRALEVLHGHTNQVIKQRREVLQQEEENKTHGEDDFGRKKKMLFLDMLLKSKIDGKPLSDDDIRDEVSTFMFGGHDTTAAAVSFALYNLAHHPECQQRAFEEIRSIFGDDKDQPCTYNDLQEMKYLEMVIKETLRLYPSAPFITRNSGNGFVYDGVTYPKNMTVGVLIYGIHRDPDHFPEPERFDPERFTPENVAKRGPFAYIPFSAGPRNCIGQKFGMFEMKTTLSRILRNFELKPATPRHVVQISSDTILKSANGVRISFGERIYK